MQPGQVYRYLVRIWLYVLDASLVRKRAHRRPRKHWRDYVDHAGLVSAQKSGTWLGKGKPGTLCLGYCPCDPTRDKGQKMNGWRKFSGSVIYEMVKYEPIPQCIAAHKPAPWQTATPLRYEVFQHLTYCVWAVLFSRYSSCRDGMWFPKQDLHCNNPWSRLWEEKRRVWGDWRIK